MPEPITEPSVLRPGDPIRIVLTDGTVYDRVVQNVDGDTITTHLPVASIVAGWFDGTAEPTTNPEGYEPDPDDLTRAQLAESDPMLRAVADSLDDWLHAHHGITSSHHNAGSFWTLLHKRGYRIVPNKAVPDPAAVMPAATD